MLKTRPLSDPQMSQGKIGRLNFSVKTTLFRY